MQIKAVRVKADFAQYKMGEIITDQATIARVMGSEQSAFVVSVPMADVPSNPSAVPAAPAVVDPTPTQSATPEKN